jgi:class 3 adenylate cyclase/tetratricopeptide (TPR) repeat protein
MHCPKCQHDNPATHQFCDSCGAPLPTACPSCGFGNRPAARFCGGCGAALTAQPTSHRAAPDRRMPRHLVERILTSRAALLGERKQVTILFADIKGSTERIQRMDPEAAANLLEPVLQAMVDAVHRFEGTVNRVQGDGIMALFGAPLAHEDDAARACYAALAIQRAVRSLPESDWQVRVGVHSGEVVVRSIADDLSMHYDALGMAVHLASRVEKLAAPGTIRLTAATHRQAQGFVTAAPLGPTAIAGIDAPVELFELTGTRASRTRWQARAASGLSRFIGREAELRAIEQALARVRAGGGEMVAVIGDPGTGKSRLVHEFLHGEAAQGAVLLEAGAATYGRASPYLPITNLLRAWLGVTERDARADIARKLRERLARIDEKLLAFLPVLHALLDLGTDPEWERLDLPQRRRRIVEALKALVLQAAAERPAIVVLEDLQWIDAETEAVLDSVVESLGVARLLLLVTYRPEYGDRWAGAARCTTIALAPLARWLADHLLRHLMGDDPGLLPIKRLLIERTQGNPLFIEESVRTLVEGGALVGEPGRYRAAKRVSEISVPPTVQAVLAARIDRLRPEARALLQLAATIGQTVPPALLQAVAGLPEARLAEILGELQAADFLYEAHREPALEYALKHALSRDVAYESLLIDERHRLHARILAELERLYAGRLDEQIDNLAEHAFRAGLWPVAAKYLLRACLRAIARSATRGAVALFECGLEAVAHLPDDEARAKLAIDLRLIVQNALIPLGDQVELVRRLTEAEALARRLGDVRRLGLVYCALTVALWMAGEHTRAMAAGELALAAVQELGSPPLEIGARFSLGMVHHAFGNFAQSAAIHRELLEGFPPEMERERLGWVGYPSVLIRTFLAGALVDTGEFDEAERHVREGCRIADELGHPYSRAMICGVAGHLRIERNDAAGAAALLEPILALCREEEVWAMVPAIAARLGWAQARCGRVAEALAAVEPALQPAIYRRGGQYTWIYLFLAAGEVYLAAGRHAEALAHAAEAERLARANQEAAHLARALKLRGDVLAPSAAPGDEEAAASSYLEALALAEPRGMRPLVAQCQLGLGELHLAHGRPRRAEPHLDRAAELYRDLGLAAGRARALRALPPAMRRPA